MSNLPYRQIHLDFHTPALPFTLGRHFEKKKFQKILKSARINSVTLTGRCHHGHIYYDTKLPAKHPQLANDFLMMEVDACHEVGIKAPIYLTVGWDAFSADRHPEWLERKPDGSLYGFDDYGQLSPGWKTLCFNTPYLDYLKYQIVDTMKHFGSKLDGLFFDIVWQDPCSCNYCIEKMLNLNLDPTNEKDRILFSKITEQFLKDEISQTVRFEDKACQVFFNEGNILPSIRKNLSEYSHLEIESLPSGEWGYQHFPTTVRYAKNLGKEYVGMTGKFHKVWADFGSYKNKAALEYETFLALAHGAKCSIGDQMYPDGTLQLATYELIGSVYRQVEKLEKYNDGSQALTEIAIVHPGIIADSELKVDLSLAGAVNMLNEKHYQFDIVDQWMDWTKYKLIILPDKIILLEGLKRKIQGYFEKTDGKILATYKSGLDAENRFLPDWGINYIGKNTFVPTYGKYHGLFENNLPNGELVLHGEGLLVSPQGAQVLGDEYRPLFQRNYQHYYSHFQAPVSENKENPVATSSDRVYYFSHPLFEMYKRQGVLQYKQMINLIVDEALGQPVLKTNMPSSGDIILNHNEERGELILNLLHYIPQRKAIELDTIEEVIPLYNVKIVLSVENISKQINTDIKKIKNIRAFQNNVEIEYRLTENLLEFVVPEVKGYEIVTIKY